MKTGDIDLTAFSDGCRARSYDEEHGTLTDNPNTIGSLASHSWYRGYNFDEERPDDIALIKSLTGHKIDRKTNTP